VIQLLIYGMEQTLVMPIVLLVSLAILAMVVFVYYATILVPHAQL
jgi:hypothetical protein